MESSSTNSGSSSITVTFDVTRDVDLAAVDVQNRVSTALGRLPGEVRTNGVTVQKGQTGFVLAAGIYSEKAEYDSLFISNYIDVYVKDALKRLAGVGDVQIFGERTLLDARVARSAQARQPRRSPPRTSSMRCASRTCRLPPARSGSRPPGRIRSTRSASAPPDGCASSASSRTSSSRRRRRNARPVEGRRPTSSSAPKPTRSQLRFQGVDAVGFGVTQLPSANALDVERAVRAELDRLALAFPPGLKYQIAFNTTQVVAESIREVADDTRRGDRARRPGDVPVPPELAQRRSSRRSRFRCRSSARSRSSS